MIVPAGRKSLASCLFAGGMLLAVAAPVLGQRTVALGWAPTRDEAIVVQQPAAVGSGVRGAVGYADEIGPVGPARGVRRPARLMPRSSVGRMHEQYVEGPPVAQELSVPQGMAEGHFGSEGHCATCGGDGGGQCVDCCGNWNSCGPVPICCLLPRPQLDNLELIAGVHGFTGPLNRGASGSFGFHQGFNYALPICGDWGCGQIGAVRTQSNFDGSFVTPDEQRNQIFLTSGLFRRVDWGLQAGLVFDYLHDEWDYEVDLAQLRGELGWKFACRHELGFRFSVGVNDDVGTINDPTVVNEADLVTLRRRDASFEVNDLFAFYYRRQFACGGEGRLFGGFTNHHQGLLGGDARLPINACWSLAADFLYVAPSDEQGVVGYRDETWNVSIGVVWTPFAKPGCGPGYCRPLFDVANNGTFATLLR